MSNDSSNPAQAPAEVRTGWLWRISHRPGLNLGPPSWVVFMTIMVYLTIQVVLLIFTIILAVAHHNINYTLDDSVIAEFIAVLIGEGLAAALVIRITRRRGLKLGLIGLGRRPQLKDLYKAIIGFVIFYGILIVIGLVATTLWPGINNQQQDVGFKHLNNGLETVGAFVALVILPPLGEEVLFRGYLYAGLRLFWRLWPSLLTTSLLFGSAHLLTGDTGLVWAAGLDTFILSGVLVYLRHNTGALYSGMLVHMLNNLIAFFVIIK